MFRRLGGPALAIAALACAGVLVPQNATASSRGTCSPSPYAYAGLVGQSAVAGVRATIAAAAQPQVASGHVAGWIGVGGPGLGAGGRDAWIQIGINSLPGRGSTIYAEAMIPGYGQAYKELGEVAVGRPVQVGVVELPGRPGWWQATVDGRAVTKAVHLEGSHGAWQPMAITESWNAGTPACNRFAYRFAAVRVSTGRGGWRPLAGAGTLTDPGYRVTRRTSSGFVAGSAA